MASSALPWLWVIETLASLKQVDALILKESDEKVPEISGDLGKDTKEMVNLRVLESLASQQAGTNRNLSPATVYDKSFSLADCCEDVVGHILCQLKDASLEEHPSFVFLKAKSGLSTTISDPKGRPDTAEVMYPGSDQKAAQVYTAEVMYPGSDQKAAQETILTFRNMENLNDFFQENDRNRNLTPSKRDFGHLDSESQVSKSHDVSPSSDPVGDSIDLPNQAREKNTFETNTSVKKSRSTPSIIVSCDKSHTKVSPYKPQGAGNPQKQWYSDKVRFLKDRVDNVVGKRDFLSSRCTLSSQSLTMENFTELSLCKKCKKSGDLLVCSANPCSVLVHRSCLGTSPNFDNHGKFLCPLCWYSHKIAEFHWIEETASLARKDLSAFIGFENVHSPNKFPIKTTILEKNHRTEDDNANRNNQTHEKNGNQMNNYSKGKEKIDNSSQVKSSIAKDPLIEKHSPELGKRKPNAEAAEGSSDRPCMKEEQHNSAPPKLRRKKVFWTAKEVKVLKKGFKKFHGYHDKWKAILECGRHVFPQGRTAGDLKDKWRNLGRSQSQLPCL